MPLASPSLFTGIPLKLNETNISTKRLENHNYIGGYRHQLAICKHDREELKKGVPRNNFQISSLAPKPLGHVASSKPTIIII